jgi:lysophospholipid acyltransferase (LPLAT)-like uncharacterized protein
LPDHSGSATTSTSPRLGAWVKLKRDPKFVWLWKALAPPVAAYMYIHARLTLRTSTVLRRGPGAEFQGAAVYVNWHRYVPFLCIHYGQRRFWLLMSSAPYMEPVALWCRWLGLTVIRAGPGERSRESLGILLEALKRGESVALAADGPAGPGFVAKPGCVELARSAGVPIIAVSCRSRKGRSNLTRWDRLYDVRKFDDIEVCYGEPFLPAPADSEAVTVGRVQRALEDLPSPD